jgi:hypothetical protein
MGTSITIDDDLLAEAEALAARSGRTLNAVVEDALREAFARQSAEGTRKRTELPVFTGGRGVQQGVNLDDNSALLDLMEGLTEEGDR